MTTPSSTSPIAANMLNPALMAGITAAAALGYEGEAERRLMPWPLAFVVAPLVLHRSTREALPSRISVHLATWVSREALIRAGFPQRARALAGHVRDGIRFGLDHGGLAISEGAVRSLVRDLDVGEDGDVLSVLTKAHFSGRWFTKLDETSTVFSILGVSP